MYQLCPLRTGFSIQWSRTIFNTQKITNSKQNNILSNAFPIPKSVNTIEKKFFFCLHLKYRLKYTNRAYWSLNSFKALPEDFNFSYPWLLLFFSFFFFFFCYFKIDPPLMMSVVQLQFNLKFLFCEFGYRQRY